MLSAKEIDAALHRVADSPIGGHLTAEEATAVRAVLYQLRLDCGTARARAERLGATLLRSESAAGLARLESENDRLVGQVLDLEAELRHARTKMAAAAQELEAARAAADRHKKALQTWREKARRLEHGKRRE